MNLMSAPVYSTLDRSVAAAAEMTWLASPGAPGWTIGGGPLCAASGAAGVAAGAVAEVVRHAADAASIKKAIATRGGGRLFKTCQGYTKRVIRSAARWPDRCVPPGAPARTPRRERRGPASG